MAMLDHAQNDAAFVVGHIFLLWRLPVLKAGVEIGRRIHIFALVMPADFADGIGDPLARFRPALEGAVVVHPAGGRQAGVGAVAVDVGKGVAGREIPRRGIAVSVVPDHAAGEVPVFVVGHDVLDAVEPEKRAVAFVLVINTAGVDLVADNMVLMVADLQNDPAASIRREPPWTIEKQAGAMLAALDAGHDAELAEAPAAAHQHHPAFVFSYIIRDLAPERCRHGDEERVAIEVL